MTILESTVVKYLEESAQKIRKGECALTEDEALDIVSSIAHIAVSREQACNYLNVKSSRFSELIKEGKVPKGKKSVGWNELRWYKDELVKALHKIRRKCF